MRSSYIEFEFIAFPTVQPRNTIAGRAVRTLPGCTVTGGGAQVALLRSPILHAGIFILPRKAVMPVQGVPKPAIAPPTLAAPYHPILAQPKRPLPSEKSQIPARSPAQQ